MKTLYVNEISPGLLISGESFVVVDVKTANDKNGKPYYDLILGDKTGQIRAKVWSDFISQVDKNSLKVSTVSTIDARVEQYKGQLQLSVISMKVCTDPKLDEYMEASIFPPEEMWVELTKIVGEIKDAHIKQLLENLMNHPEWSVRYKSWSAGPVVHHDFRGGLLQHVLEMLASVNGMERFYPEANFDIVRAGIIVHDVGKLIEVNCEGLVSSHTKYGVLIDHMALGLDIIRELKPEDMPENTYTHLRHIILSHHGTKEFGSPVTPATIEAWLVHCADNMSAKPRIAQNVLKHEATDNDGLTGFNRWIGGRMWSGD